MLRLYRPVYWTMVSSIHLDRSARRVASRIRQSTAAIGIGQQTMLSIDTEGPTREDQPPGGQEPLGGGIRRLAAIVTRSARESASIFRMTLPRCAFTVISLMPS